MSLITFHRFLISAAILFCLAYAGWEIHAFRTSGSAGDLILAAVFLCLGGLLGIYLRRLAHFLFHGDARHRPED